MRTTNVFVKLVVVLLLLLLVLLQLQGERGTSRLRCLQQPSQGSHVATLLLLLHMLLLLAVLMLL
jgi:hypothetical protein